MGDNRDNRGNAQSRFNLQLLHLLCHNNSLERCTKSLGLSSAIFLASCKTMGQIMSGVAVFFCHIMQKAKSAGTDY